MSVAAPAGGKPDANELAAQRTDLALERTLMAADRTLMAWIRTAISMIGFGFTLFKFLQYMVEQNMTQRPMSLSGPRNLSLAFIGLGILSLAIAVLQHWQFLKRARLENHVSSSSLALIVAGIVALIGVLAFMNVLARIGPF